MPRFLRDLVANTEDFHNDDCWLAKFGILKEASGNGVRREGLYYESVDVHCSEAGGASAARSAGGAGSAPCAKHARARARICIRTCAYAGVRTRATCKQEPQHRY